MPSEKTPPVESNLERLAEDFARLETENGMLRASLVEARATIATLEMDNGMLRAAFAAPPRAREQLLEKAAPMRDNSVSSVSTSLAPVG